MINRNNLFLFYTGEHICILYSGVSHSLLASHRWESPTPHCPITDGQGQQCHVQTGFKRMVSNTLLAKQPRFWNGKSKRSLGIKAAPGRISLSLRRQGSPRRCLTFAPHLKRRQEGGKQITDGSECSSLSVLWTIQNLIFAHDRDYGVPETLPTIAFQPMKLCYCRGCQVLWRNEAPGGGTSCLIPAQTNQPRALWPTWITLAATPHQVSLCLTWTQKPERGKNERKAKPQRPEFDFRKIKYTKKKETEI